MWTRPEPEPQPEPLPPLRRLGVHASDYAWAVSSIWEGARRPHPPERFRHGGLAPVVLVPGVLESWTMMRLIAERLNRAGHPVHVLPELRLNTAPLAEGAALVEEHLRAGDLRDAVIVAHSKGGLIAKLVLLGEEQERVARVIAIATPFAGSKLARWMPTRTLRSLHPSDPSIRDLVARTEADARIVSIHPPFDPHIPGGSRLAGAENVPTAESGHFRILGSPEVLDAVEHLAGHDPVTGS
ncbi:MULTISPECIES: esterase/lipase family protein [unclassified Leucobacter]|uniref:esterase/lipase family protein n=1 Tax=unclassified Leucobacter TaxID=2621730 RepID=UPI0030165C73